MAERKVTVAVPPTGETKEGVEVQIEESTERWSEFKFEDGTVLRAKIAIMSAVRVAGEYDPLGNPMYITNMTPMFTIVSAPDHLRKKVQ